MAKIDLEKTAKLRKPPQRLLSPYQPVRCMRKGSDKRDRYLKPKVGITVCQRLFTTKK